LLCAHHLLVSHGHAVDALRARVKTPIGIALNFMPAHPASSSPTDVLAAARVDGYFNRWFVEPVAGRGYPQDMLELYAEQMPEFPASDLELMARPIDVLGVNYYERAIVEHAEDGSRLRRRHVQRAESERTADREIYAPGLGEVLRWLHQEYDFPRLVITENGAAYPDVLGVDGRVHDAPRTAFLKEHLAEVARTCREGVPVDTYFAWSLLDNFEWSEGYSLRYGLVHVDFETQKRVPKDSAHFFRSLARP
jgi:beta-glucosidase